MSRRISRSPPPPMNPPVAATSYRRGSPERRREYIRGRSPYARQPAPRQYSSPHARHSRAQSPLPYNSYPPRSSNNHQNAYFPSEGRAMSPVRRQNSRSPPPLQNIYRPTVSRHVNQSRYDVSSRFESPPRYSSSLRQNNYSADYAFGRQPTAGNSNFRERSPAVRRRASPPPPQIRSGSRSPRSRIQPVFSGERSPQRNRSAFRDIDREDEFDRSRPRFRDRETDARGLPAYYPRHVEHRSHHHPRGDPCPFLGFFGLSSNTTETDLRRVIELYAKVRKVTLIMDVKTGMSRRFAFCEFESTEDAALVRNKMDGTNLQSRNIRVDFSVTRRPHSPTPGQYRGRTSSPSHDYQERDRQREHPQEWGQNREHEKDFNNIRSSNYLKNTSTIYNKNNANSSDSTALKESGRSISPEDLGKNEGGMAFAPNSNLSSGNFENRPTNCVQSPSSYSKAHGQFSGRSEMLDSPSVDGYPVATVSKVPSVNAARSSFEDDSSAQLNRSPNRDRF